MNAPIKPVIGDLLAHRSQEGGWVSYGETYLTHDAQTVSSIGKAVGNVPRLPTRRPRQDCRISRDGILREIA